MVKFAVDTSKDSLEELEDAMEVLLAAVKKRRGDTQPVTKESPQEEEAIDAGFMKISVSDPDLDQKEPTLNELMSKESITEGELTGMFKECPYPEDKDNKKKEKDPGPEIEIVEIEDPK